VVRFRNPSLELKSWRHYGRAGQRDPYFYRAICQRGNRELGEGAGEGEKNLLLGHSLIIPAIGGGSERPWQRGDY